MTQSTVIETYYSLDAEKKLLTAQWDGVRDREDMWQLLFGILDALTTMPEQFGALSGRFAIDTANSEVDDEDLACEELQVALAPEGLHQLKESLRQRDEQGSQLMPDSLVLRTNATLLLPEAVRQVRVIAFDFEELEDRGPLPMQPVKFSGCPEGVRTWQTRADSSAFEEDAPLYVEIMCVLDRWEQRISLSLHSCFDIWHARRFDGQPNQVGRVNQEHWKGVLQRIIDKTGRSGRLTGESLR